MVPGCRYVACNTHYVCSPLPSRLPLRVTDWGTIGWLLQNRKVDLWKYRYYIFLNSSVRGPYLPPYLQVCARGVEEGN